MRRPNSLASFASIGYENGMKWIPPVTVVAVILAGLFAPNLNAQSAVAPSTPPVHVAGPGLTLLRFGLHKSQLDMGKGTGYVHYSEFGPPLKAPRTVYEISKWVKENEDENALLTGYIKIDKAGSYSFRTNSNWDRNELIIDGKIVCKFRDLDQVLPVELPAGLLPIVLVGYAKLTKEVTVQWIPSGQTKWMDIPKNLLSHPPYVAPSATLR